MSEWRHRSNGSCLLKRGRRATILPPIPEKSTLASQMLVKRLSVEPQTCILLDRLKTDTDRLLHQTRASFSRFRRKTDLPANSILFRQSKTERRRNSFSQMDSIDIEGYSMVSLENGKTRVPTIQRSVIVTNPNIRKPRRIHAVLNVNTSTSDGHELSSLQTPPPSPLVRSAGIHQPFSRIFHTRRSLAHPEELKESRQSIRAAMGRLPLRIRRYGPANPIICDNQTMDYRYVHLSRPYRSAPLGISVVKSEEGFVTCRLNEELAVLPSTFHPTIGEIITEVDGQDCRGWSKEDLLKHVKGRLSILIRLKIVSD